MRLTKALFPLALFASSLAAGQSPSDRKGIEQMNQEFVVAMKSKDMKWFDKVAAPDYYELETNGKKSNRKQSMEAMKQGFAMMTVTSIVPKVVSVKKKGKGLVAVEQADFVASMTPPGAKKASIMKMHLKYEEMWTHDGGKWMIHYLKTLSESTTIDGKPVKNGM